MNSGVWQRYFERLGWGKGLLSFSIGLVSAWLLFVTLSRDYFDYIYFAKVKAQDAYIYPQMRYTVFDIVLIAWCIDGLAACFFLFRDARQRRNMSRLSLRTTLAFAAGFCILVIGGLVGTYIRSMGL